MNNENFTPGPWKAKGRTICPENQSDPLNTEIVCRIHENRFASREEGNAVLIAAAPEMYAKLAELAEELRPIMPGLAVEISKLLKKVRGEK